MMSHLDHHTTDIMTMTSHDATLTYALALPSGERHLSVDLSPAISGMGGEHQKFVAHFGLKESEENIILETLRGACSVDAFFEYFGRTWLEALDRWGTMAFMAEYRKEHGKDNYAQLDDWEVLYDLASKNILPQTIELAFIEHY